MKGFATTVSAALLLLTTGSAPYAPPAADAPCTGQIHANPGFERGTTGWTAGPRIIVLGDPTRPAHSGRAYATFAGLDVTHTDLLRTTVTVPADCELTVRFWVRTTTTEISRGDYLNVGLAVTGIPRRRDSRWPSTVGRSGGSTACRPGRRRPSAPRPSVSSPARRPATASPPSTSTT
ncbi:hypothetical protein [Micromonospora endophytica]|uniref:hypothetical protein n=1 Tax=Micromonospora endophytica TaxID=515350 RepID=UPI00201736F9|nr:hypothetical protein [Micromonospora endophytica]